MYSQGDRIQFESDLEAHQDSKKAQTREVKHQNSYSVFNQTLELELSLEYDKNRKVFGDKNMEFSVVIVLNGKTKSGGYAKFNVATIFNNQLQKQKQTLYLKQCPDPNAYLEVQFDYDSVGEGQQLSVISNIQENDLSKVNFNEDTTLSSVICEIGRTISKFQKIGDKLKSNKNQVKLPCLEDENRLLVQSISRLQAALVQKDADIRILKEQHASKIRELETATTNKKNLYKQNIGNENSNENQFKKLYDDSLQEIQMLKSELKFRKTENSDMLPTSSSYEKPEQFQDVQDLRKENTELQLLLASSSYRLAQLFNASYEYGGPQLLDYLQSSVGITQKE